MIGLAVFSCHSNDSCLLAITLIEDQQDHLTVAEFADELVC
jgi:hypothetical protein